MNKVEYKELIAFHPGYYLNDIIEDMGITQDEFSKRLGTTGKHLSDLLRAKIKLSDEIALKLSIMFGTSIDVWLNLQKTYTEKVLEIERRKATDAEVEFIKSIDYGFFVSINELPNVKKPEEKVEELLRYLNVFSFDVLRQPNFLVNCNCRTAINKVQEKNIINSNAWVQTALNIGRSSKTDSLDLKKLKSCLPEIRSMTLKSPDDYIQRLEQIFASCGVAFVLLPHLKNSGVNGAVKWIDKEKVILALNDRRKYADTFWFTLFHEIGHVFQQKIAMLIINSDFKEMVDTNKKLEDDANEFAQNYLIPLDLYSIFVSNNDFSLKSILHFAKEIDIHPGIIVGRLQREEIIGYNSGLNALKEKYTIMC